MCIMSWASSSMTHWHFPKVGDVLAGLSVAGILLPESVAYASIAGLTPIHALMGCLIGLMVYALVGCSRQAIVSPTSSAAAVFASTAALGSDMGFGLVIVTGVLFILVGLLKGGFIGSFISRPVMQGFAWSLAMMIMLKQLPHLLGIETQEQLFFPLLHEVWQNISHIHVPSMVTGVVALVVWLVFHTLNYKYLPSSLVVLVGGTGLLYLLRSSSLNIDWQGIKQVGEIPLSELGLHLPQLGLQQWLSLIQLAPALLLIIFAESWESVQMLASEAGERVDPNRELVALGIANVMAGGMAALPVGAGFSASNASLNAGSNSKWAGIVTCVSLAILLWLGRGMLAHIPIPILAAVVIGILSHHLFPLEIIDSLKLGKDSWLALVCIATVLCFGVLFGMTVSVGLSLLLALYRFSQPLMTELGRLNNSHDFVDKHSHSDAVTTKGVLILRPEEPLFFANAERIFDNMLALAESQQANHIIISMESSDNLDATTLFAFAEFYQKLQMQQRQLSLARVKERVRQSIQRLSVQKNGHLCRCIGA